MNAKQASTIEKTTSEIYPFHAGDYGLLLVSMEDTRLRIERLAKALWWKAQHKKRLELIKW